MPLLHYCHYLYFRYKFSKTSWENPYYPVCAHEAAHAVFAVYRCQAPLRYIRIWETSNPPQLRGITRSHKNFFCSQKDLVTMILVGPLLQHIIEKDFKQVEKGWKKEWPWEWVKEFSMDDFASAQTYIEKSNDLKNVLNNLLEKLFLEINRIEKVTQALLNNKYSLSLNQFFIASCSSYREYCYFYLRDSLRVWWKSCKITEQ